eukprot:m.189821 g.189821  ORF g.189821 m.189821 type:complete len:309 (-) comp24865_c0_seq1:263-1189(-)
MAGADDLVAEQLATRVAAGPASTPPSPVTRKSKRCGEKLPPPTPAKRRRPRPAQERTVHSASMRTMPPRRIFKTEPGAAAVPGPGLQPHHPRAAQQPSPSQQCVNIKIEPRRQVVVKHESQPTAATPAAPRHPTTTAPRATPAAVHSLPHGHGKAIVKREQSADSTTGTSGAASASSSAVVRRPPPQKKARPKRAKKEPSVPGTTLMGFGKHSALSYKQVYKKHYDYVMWCRTIEPSKMWCEMRDFLDYVDCVYGKPPPPARHTCPIHNLPLRGPLLVKNPRNKGRRYYSCPESLGGDCGRSGGFRWA